MSDPKRLLRSERSLTPLVASVVSVGALTGALLYAWEESPVWIQWSLVLHGLAGIAATFALLSYLLLHFRRTLAIRRAAVLTSGLSTLPVVIAFLGSGWHLALYGQREDTPWMLPLHVASSAAFLGIGALHIALHAWFRTPKSRRRAESDAGPPATRRTLGIVIVANAAALATIGAASAIHLAAASARTTTPAVADYEYRYGDHPFRPSQTETVHGGFVESEQIANSQRCASCHPDIAVQWYASAHREAASDATYVTNVNLLAEKQGISATRYCEGCHGPVALLSGELSPGGEHAGVPGTSAHREGVSCMGCHGIESIVHLKGVGSYRFEPARDQLFARSTNPVLGRIHNWVVRTRPEQHRRDVGRPLLRDSKVCATCHAQFMDEDVNDWGWVKMQDEYTAWLESPYSKQRDEDFADATSG